MLTITISEIKGIFESHRVVLPNGPSVSSNRDNNSRLRFALSETSHIYNQQQTSGFDAHKAVVQILSLPSITTISEVRFKIGFC